ncbi:MAG: AMP-binding protein [Syntrophomonadaceae bacterium]
MMTGRNYISELITKNAKDPGKTALQLFSGEVLTYGELIALKDQTQAVLSQLNIEPHERVALITSNSLLIVPLTVGLMESSTCVPLDPELTEAQYTEYFNLLSVDYLVCDQAATPAIEAAVAAGIGVITLGVPETVPPIAIKFDLSYQSRIPSSQEYKNDQTAFIFTTSGTTSKPKIVPVLYRNLAESLEIEAQNYGYTENSIQLLVVKLHLAIAIRAALRILISNSQMIYTDGVYPKRMADILLRFPITHLNFQPAGMLALYEYFEKNVLEYTPQHRLNISVMGAPLPSHLKQSIEKLFNAQLRDIYGLTEVGVIASTTQVPKGYKNGSVGCPVFQSIKILDNEVLVKGPGVFPGYENDPELNRDTFVEGWFRTGDIGYIDDDGYLFLTGRIKELINRGGEKVSPYEVEEAILSLGNIKDVAVFPYPNNKGYENVGAVIVSDEEPAIGLKDLRSALKEKIKPFKLPTILYKASKIPTGSANKVQRSLLNQQLLDRGWIPETIKNPFLAEGMEMTSTQLTLVEIWKSILEQDYIALDEDFFDLGGDSLSAAEVLASIEAKFGCMLPVNDFVKKSTIRELADLVDQAPKSNPLKHLVPVRPGGSRIPIFFVHERSCEVVTYYHVAEFIDRDRPVYGFRCNWQAEGWGEITDIRDVAIAYASELRQIKPEGPYYIAGLSVGGQIGFEMGCILSEQGHEAVVFMMDTFSREYIWDKAIHNAARYTLDGVKNTPFRRIPHLIGKKIVTFYRVFILRRIFMKPVRVQINPLSHESEEFEGALSPSDRFIMLLSKKHRPVFFPGEVCYFRALITRPNDNKESYLAWEALSKKFTLFESNCVHADFVKPEFAADTAAKMNSVMESHEATRGSTVIGAG